MLFSLGRIIASLLELCKITLIQTSLSLALHKILYSNIISLMNSKHWLVKIYSFENKIIISFSSRSATNSHTPSPVWPTDSTIQTAAYSCPASAIVSLAYSITSEHISLRSRYFSIPLNCYAALSRGCWLWSIP